MAPEVTCHRMAAYPADRALLRGEVFRLDRAVIEAAGARCRPNYRGIVLLAHRVRFATRRRTRRIEALLVHFPGESTNRGRPGAPLTRPRHSVPPRALGPAYG